MRPIFRTRSSASSSTPTGFPSMAGRTPLPCLQAWLPECPGAGACLSAADEAATRSRLAARFTQAVLWRSSRRAVTTLVRPSAITTRGVTHHQCS
jgi:hypothetical protein